MNKIKKLIDKKRKKDNDLYLLINIALLLFLLIILFTLYATLSDGKYTIGFGITLLLSIIIYRSYMLKKLRKRNDY